MPLDERCERSYVLFMPNPTPSFPKVCSCGRSYGKKSLEFVGYTDVPEGADPAAEPPYRLESRNCTCLSTISIELPYV